MIGPCIDFTFAARADDIAGTISLVAKKRAAPMNALLLVGLGWIQCRIRPLRVAHDSAFGGERLVVTRTIPIATPFPNVAGHIVETIAVRRKRFHRRDAGE